MRELLVGAEAFGLPRSRILDYRFDVKRGWFGSQTICILVTAEREFKGTGRSQDVAVQDAIETWEKHFLLMEDADPEVGVPVTPAIRFAARQDALEGTADFANAAVDESGYMSSQVFSRRRSAVRFAPNVE